MKQKRWLAVALVLLAALVGGALTRAAPDQTVESFLQELYAERARALITASRPPPGLERYYDLTVTGGRFAHAHETGRIAYLHAWARARSLDVAVAETQVTNLKVKRSGDVATVSLITRTRLGYRYAGDDRLNEMGIGSWHWLQLIRSEDGWKVQKEYYLDALGGEQTQPYAPTPAGEGSSNLPSKTAGQRPPAPPARSDNPAEKGRLDRAGVAAYAEKYCGAAWGCGNNSDYNERYRSYRNLGGDCANFASQALVEGGRLKPDWAWRAGSACWLNAQAFTRHMLQSGRATLLARGTYPQVAGAASRLQPGDIVAYQEKGTIVHVSVVTAADTAGVPLVTAHTADRFRNPWDLGWDARTVYWFLQMRD